MGVLGRLIGAGIGAGVAHLVYQRLAEPSSTSEALARVNHRGEAVTLAQGPAIVSGAVLGAAATPGLSIAQRAATALAVAGSGALGAYDDLFGDSDAKGLRGHLTAATKGELTTGFIKLIGLFAIGTTAGTVARRGRGGVVDAVLAGAVIAGSANLVNLLDLRPGRATKVFALASVPYVLVDSGAMLAGSQGAALAMLPNDLKERSMLGDTGANALGAAWGVCAVTRMSRGSLLAATGVIAGATLLSERVSFSDLIARHPAAVWFDELGRSTTPGR